MLNKKEKRKLIISEMVNFQDAKLVVVGKCSGELVYDHTKLKSQYGCDLVLKNNQNQFWMLNKVIDAEFEEL